MVGPHGGFEVMDAKQLIAFLNAIKVGELDTIEGKLGEARSACEELGQPDLAASLSEAHDALEGLDMKLYRKRVQHVLSRLGHLA